MVSRKWTNREINEALQRLGACYELPPERSATLEARVRREVIARYGRFDVPLTPSASFRLQATSAQESTAPRTGMLVLLRPAFAFAAIAAVAVGAVMAFQRSGWGTFRAQGVRQPVVTPQAEMVAVAAPIVPGSGVAVSVFGVTPLRVRVDEGELRTDHNPSQPSTGTSSMLGRPPFIQRGGAQVPPLRVRGGKGELRSGRRLNPAAGVFDQWGESVFSDEEYLRSEREGKNVFNS